LATPIGTADAETAGGISVIAGYGIAIAGALEQAGVDSARVFAALGMRETLSNDPLKRLPLETVTRLFRASVDATGDPYFGLAVARAMHPSALHALGYGLLASASLRDFCTRVQRYFRLVSQTSRVELVESDTELRLSTIPLVEVAPESGDAWLGMLHRLIRLLYHDDFRPLAVELVHDAPEAGDAPYVEFFGAPVRFSRAAATLVLARSDLDVPLRGACPELAQFNDMLAASYLARRDRADTVANVRARIVELLPSGECSKRRVAAALGMSASSLQQRLTERGTSFHVLVNEIRREHACSYLRQSGVSVTEITFLLGFADASNFTRAFKRWTGVSPTRFRDEGAAALACGDG